MQDAHARTRPARTRVIAVLLVLAVFGGGFAWYRHHEAAAQRQACVDMFAYSMQADQQGYTGPLRDPKFLRDRDRCLG